MSKTNKHDVQVQRIKSNHHTLQVIIATTLPLALQLIAMLL